MDVPTRASLELRRAGDVQMRGRRCTDFTLSGIPQGSILGREFDEFLVHLLVLLLSGRQLHAQ